MQFDCPRCGHSWRKTFQNGADTIPDSIIAKQQADLVQSKNGDAIGMTVFSIICAIITFACGYYCYSHESSSTHMQNLWLVGETEVTDYNWLWYILAFLAFVFLLITIGCIGSAVEKRDEAKHIKEMTVSDFRTSSYRQ